MSSRNRDAKGKTVSHLEIAVDKIRERDGKKRNSACHTLGSRSR